MMKTTRISLEPFLSFSSFFTPTRSGGVSYLLNRPEVRRYQIFSYGRIAILEGLKILNCKGNINFLIPSYICQSAVEPFNKLGIEVRFYESDANLQPDIADIRSKIDRNTRGIMVVNYFGFPQQLDEVKDICKTLKLYLVEDNAHGFLSKKGSQLLGTLGDIGISSLWKYLPIPNGGILYINNAHLVKREEEIIKHPEYNRFRPTDNKRYTMFIIASLLTNLEMRFGFPSHYLKNLYGATSQKGKPQEHQAFNYNLGVSKTALRLARSVNVETIIRERRKNFDFWLQVFHQTNGVRIVFNDLADGIAPLFFPVIVEKPQEFLQQMKDRGIPALCWPPLAKSIINNPDYPSANFLSQHLVILPVHQCVDRNKLKRTLLH